MPQFSPRKYPGNKFMTYSIPSFLLVEGPELYTTKDTLSVIPREQVIYDDLVFTLEHNPLQYARPIVDLEHYGPTIKGNNIFFKAGKQAGVQNFLCDVNFSSLLDKHFSQFNLFEPVYTAPSDANMMLFLDQKEDFPEAKTLQEKLYQTLAASYLANVSLQTYPEKGAVGYSFPAATTPPLIVMRLSQSLQSILGQYGIIRSINGLKPF